MGQDDLMFEVQVMKSPEDHTLQELRCVFKELLSHTLTRAAAGFKSMSKWLLSPQCERLMACDVLPDHMKPGNALPSSRGGARAGCDAQGCRGWHFPPGCSQL